MSVFSPISFDSATRTRYGNVSRFNLLCDSQGQPGRDSDEGLLYYSIGNNVAINKGVSVIPLPGSRVTRIDIPEIPIGTNPGTIQNAQQIYGHEGTRSNAWILLTQFSIRYRFNVYASQTTSLPGNTTWNGTEGHWLGIVPVDQIPGLVESIRTTNSTTEFNANEFDTVHQVGYTRKNLTTPIDLPTGAFTQPLRSFQSINKFGDGNNRGAQTIHNILPMDQTPTQVKRDGNRVYAESVPLPVRLNKRIISPNEGLVFLNTWVLLRSSQDIRRTTQDNGRIVMQFQGYYATELEDLVPYFQL